MKRLDRYRWFVINGGFVVMAWAAVACGGIPESVFRVFVFGLLVVEVVVVGMGWRLGKQTVMADRMLQEFPVPLWCELAYDVAFTAWLVWLGHSWVTVAAYAATSGISGVMLIGALARRVEAESWGGET